jgi:hypothetical protein
MNLREVMFFDLDPVATMNQAQTDMPLAPSHVSGIGSTDRVGLTDPIKAADAATDRILTSLSELREGKSAEGLLGTEKVTKPHHPANPADPRVEMAVGILESCGFVISHRSLRGSVYLRWPERNALLRVADHRSRKPRGSMVVAALTFGPQVRHKSEMAVRRYMALAVGQYFLDSD